MIIIELGVLTLILFLQWKYFNSSRDAILQLKNLYPASKMNENNIYLTGDVEQITAGHNNQLFETIIHATNQYLFRNKGAADYNIVKNIADRTTEAQEEKIASEISLPLYLGLMGTFAGVMLGLLSMIVDGGLNISSGNNDKKIQSLITGVVIAMAVSFFGLLLTTINNSFNLKQAVAVRNVNRNNYYNFLQTELLPHLDNSLYSALDLLKVNISSFNQKFEENLDLFDVSFSDNIKNLKGTVSGMTEQITAVNENTRVQLQFLTELKKIGYNRMAEANIKVFDKMKESGPMLVRFIKEQQNLNENVKKANDFATQIGELLDRFNAFETNINNLGREIQQADILGADVINLVRKHLNVINQREELILDYAGRSNNEVESYLSDASERIQALKRALEAQFQTAFDFDAEGNVLQHLLRLKSIDENINDLKAAVSQKDSIDKLETKLDQLINEFKSAEIGVKTIIGKGKSGEPVRQRKRTTWIRRFFSRKS